MTTMTDNVANSATLGNFSSFHRI